MPQPRVHLEVVIARRRVAAMTRSVGSARRFALVVALVLAAPAHAAVEAQAPPRPPMHVVMMRTFFNVPVGPQPDRVAKLAATYGLRVERRLPAIQGFAVRLTARQRAALLKHEWVIGVQPERSRLIIRLGHGLRAADLARLRIAVDWRFTTQPDRSWAVARLSVPQIARLPQRTVYASPIVWIALLPYRTPEHETARWRATRRLSAA